MNIEKYRRKHIFVILTKIYPAILINKFLYVRRQQFIFGVVFLTFTDIILRRFSKKYFLLFNSAKPVLPATNSKPVNSFDLRTTLR